RRYLVAAGVLILILVAGAASAYYVTSHRFGRTVVGSSSGFDSTQTISAPKPRAGLVSPMFGVAPEHLHVGVGHVRPPFRLDWTANGISLIEFPPAIAFHHLYYATFAGKLRAISTSDGARLWTINTGRCEASGPAVSTARGGTVFETFLNPQTGGHCAANPASG